MKTQELKEIIRSVIKEELQKTLPTLIPNILSEILTGKNKNVVSEKFGTDGTVGIDGIEGTDVGKFVFKFLYVDVSVNVFL